MKVKSILVAVAVFMLSGCFFGPLEEKRSENKKQSDITTASVRGHAVCYLNGQKMFDNDFVSAKDIHQGGTVEIMDKEGTVYRTGAENCFITGLKGKRVSGLYNYHLYTDN
ncbi:hypothetical protein [Serratia sp. Se-RSBMAAmG]|uniref:hypothetical protein n=1 Tax=Serratia sp. Se-RSBMAAmG TaxID=3043305 RepID=UPI0024AFEF54|nr:hypothetical protein [Serratia sp. Se-RSBMAAmG]MDI6976145.1 hypothetical protein [Serratia sp. Se-RSBMAAmG]